MSTMHLECLQSYQEFKSVRNEWNEFMECCFPENYARTHAWLSALWETHHAGQSALIYIQRASAGGKIVAVAPLVIASENFGGFRVRMLHALGRGIGCDDFLIGSEADRTVQAVFADVNIRQSWDVAMFRRVSHVRFQEELTAVSRAMHCLEDSSVSTEHLVTLPETYQEYLESRSSKFRNNLKNAHKRLETGGDVSVEIVSPFTQTDRALALCGDVAKKSWQFKTGKSHFNTGTSSSFYGNLTKAGCGAGGEEFVVLLIGNIPVAFLLGCKRGRIYHLIDTAYDEDFRAVSVGRVLFCRTIERLIEGGGVDQFNLEGDGEYKDYFANKTDTVRLITIYQSSLYGNCIGMIRKTRLYDYVRQQLQAKSNWAG